MSHAIADEPTLGPVVEQLRRFLNADIFFCADSIRSGSSWQEIIRQELRHKELFLFIASQASLRSQFCAFEAGFAMGMNKNIRILSLDGSAPPGFFQDIQAADCLRLAARKPWLTPQEALLDALLQAVSGDSEE